MLLYLLAIYPTAAKISWLGRLSRQHEVVYACYKCKKLEPHNGAKCIFQEGGAPASTKLQEHCAAFPSKSAKKHRNETTHFGIVFTFHYALFSLGKSKVSILPMVHKKWP